MKSLTGLSVLLLAITTTSGFDNFEECEDTVFNVVNNHYNPRDLCPETNNFLTKELHFRKQYLNELISKQKDVDFELTSDIVNNLMELLPAKRRKFPGDQIKCLACSSVVSVYKLLHKSGVKDVQIFPIIQKICEQFHFATPFICEGILKSYGESLVEIIKTSNATSDEMCSVFLNLKCGFGSPDVSWNVTLPDVQKPPVNETSELTKGKRTLKVLHISDTHWDRYYAEGTWAECKLPLCCRKENVLPNQEATKAGKFGGWKCDTPEITFDSMLSHIAKQHPDIDYIIWTGDIPAHDIWNQTKQDNLEVLVETVEKLKKKFPKTRVYPALGNHESVPGNLFPTKVNNDTDPMDWLYNVVSEQWKKWLPSTDFKTLRKGAFFTTLIEKGLRLVSMNMNYCYTFNWWLVNEKSDPLNELHWLAGILQEAEKKGEKVHIIGHIPPGSTDCLRTWQTNYYKIINRYEATVHAQFFGHTHADEFQLMYDTKNTSRPVAIAYTGPSLTTYTYHNPSYRIYYIQGDVNKPSRYVLDHETWYLDLEKSNKENKADWKLLYKASEAYQLKNLLPRDWHNVYLKIKNSNATLQQYHKYYWNDSPKRPKCDEKTRKEYLCQIRSCVQYKD